MGGAVKVWCSLDGDGRPEQVFLEDIGSDDLIEAETPEGVAPEQLGDYTWDGSKWVYDGAMTAAREEAERATQRDALLQSQLATAAAMYVKAASLPRVQASSVCTLYDEWSGKGVKYTRGQWLRYGDDFVRVEQDHTSQPDWTPDAAPSLYTLLPLAPDGIRIWETPTHAENAFDTGERCHHPGADGDIWVSGRDGNTSEPGTDEWWSREGADGADAEPGEPERPAAEPYDPKHWYESGETCLWEGGVYVWDADGRLGVPGVWSPKDYPQGWTLVEG